MQDSFGRLLDLIILLVVALVVPVAAVSALAGETAESHAEKVGREFLKNVESYGVVRQRDMDRLESRLCELGGQPVIRLSKSTVLYSPSGDDLKMRNGRLADEDVVRYVSETHWSELEERLALDGEIEFDRGDRVELTISGRGGGLPMFKGETTVLAFPREEHTYGYGPAQ